MNERIRELAEQAGNIRINDYYTNGTVTAFTDIQLQKFAELIVRECASKVDWILAEGGRTQGDILKRHFGVE